MPIFRDHLSAIVVVALCSVLPAAAQAPEDAWPQFRGVNGSGIAAGATSLPVEFGATKNQLWKTAVPAGQSSPAIWRNRIFLTAVDVGTRKLETMALDRATGQIVWRQAITVEQLERVHVVGSAATATPVVDGERVYAYFGSYGVIAYDLNGRVIWQVPMGVLQNGFGSGTSPVIAGEMVLVNRQEPSEPFIVALDRKTGKEVWKHRYQIPPGLPTAYASYSTPLIAGQEVIVHGMNRLEALDLASGETKWWVAISSTGTSSPIVAGDLIYVASWSPFGEADQMDTLPDYEALLKNDKDGNGSLNREEVPASLNVFTRPDTPDVPGATYSVKAAFPRFDSNKDGELEREEWAAGMKVVSNLKIEHGLLAVRRGGSGDVTTTHVLWKQKTSIPEVPTPLAYQNKIYTIRNGGILTCMDAATGQLVYRGRVGTPGAYFSSPVAANGRLLVASGDGVVSVLGTGDRLEILAHNDLGEGILATPAIVGGVLYIRTSSNLMAFAQK
jgi:outer membrane protein assembly factor BamB